MFRRLLSGDLPRSRVLAFVLAVICLGLLFTPFVFPGARAHGKIRKAVGGRKGRDLAPAAAGEERYAS